jgi:hypothetical protein
MIKVDGHSHLYRDENNGAIINCDSTGYENYLRSTLNRDLRKKELDDLRKDIDEIKSLLKEFLNKS